MHVHTLHSGMCHIPVLNWVCRECYNDPHAVYETLKRRGMSLITVTDHDSIDAVEELRSHPDFFLSEEVTCQLPTGNQMHIGVYDIDDRQHVQIQRLRDDLSALLAYLREQGLFFSANHIFSSLTGRRSVEDFAWFQSSFPAFEVMNGCMLELNNRAACAAAKVTGKIGVGGSDSHTIVSLGTCWTEVPGARDKGEFLAGLRKGAGSVDGSSGSYWRLTQDIVRIGGSMVAEKPYTAPIILLGVLAPLITLANYAMERKFYRHWAASQPNLFAADYQAETAFPTGAAFVDQAFVDQAFVDEALIEEVAA